MFFRKQKQVESLIFRYLDDLRRVQENFMQAIHSRLDNCVTDQFDFLAEQTHKFESMADDVREEIKTLMYGKALIPESRGDIMGLLETIDQIPSYFELILNIIKTQKLSIPVFLIPDIRELIQVSMESCDLVIQQVEDLFMRRERIRELVSVIDQKESQCDDIERRIITRIFDSDLDPFLKLQLKELVVFMGEISDQADRVSKRINIVSLKRRV
jgi:predicted phosphate transport protein (TIGR00153 family)